MRLKDVRESFAPLIRDPLFRQELLVAGAEEEGAEGILLALREMALALKINDAQNVETGTSEAERKAVGEVLACGGAVGFVTVCAALDALGLDLVLVRKQDAAQTASSASEAQTETRAALQVNAA